MLCALIWRNVRTCEGVGVSQEAQHPLKLPFVLGLHFMVDHVPIELLKHRQGTVVLSRDADEACQEVLLRREVWRNPCGSTDVHRPYSV